MKKLAIALFATSFQIVSTAFAADDMLTISITNLTKGQIFSPPVIAVHNDKFHLFEVGKKASAGVALIAEDGTTTTLANALKSNSQVSSHLVATAPIRPGETKSFRLTAKSIHRYFSFVSMLATTNDAFVGVSNEKIDRVELSGNRLVRSMMFQFYSNAYDAGSEANTESCAHIPGPPCGSHNVRVTDGAEGYVYIHPGIHGKAELDSSALNWLNPVAKVAVSVNGD